MIEFFALVLILIPISLLIIGIVGCGIIQILSNATTKGYRWVKNLIK